jgi:hypothetical protein
MPGALRISSAADSQLITRWYAAITSGRSAAAKSRDKTALVLFVVVTIVALNAYAPAQPTPVMRLLASFLIILACVPIWLWNSGKDKRMPLLPFIAFLYCMYYALPIFVMQRYSLTWYSRSTIPETCMEYALLVACIGWMAMLAGYYCPFPKRFIWVIPRIQFHWMDVRVLQSLGCILGTVGCVSYYAGFSSRAYNTDYVQSVPSALRQVVFFFGETATIGIGILYVLQQVGCLRRISKLYLWTVLIPTRELVGLATGAVYQAISLVLFLILIHSALNRRIRWSLMLSGMMAFMILQPTKTLLRSLTNNETESVRDSVMQRAEAFITLAYTVAMGQAVMDVGVFQMAMDRLNGLSTLATTIEFTPAAIPFWGGETYRPLVEKAIPRFFYAGKLDENAGQVFGHRYGLLSTQDESTSYNLSQLVEAYINFGLWGVIIVMFLIGGFYSLSQQIFVHPAMGMGALVGGAYVMSSWLNIECNASLVLGGLPTAIAFVCCVHVLVLALRDKAVAERFYVG